MFRVFLFLLFVLVFVIPFDIDAQISGIPPALLEQFRAFIVSVNGNSNMGMLSSFIMNMPARDSRFLRRAFAAMTPNVDMTQEVVCTECGTESELEIPLTADFFWPK